MHAEAPFAISWTYLSLQAAQHFLIFEALLPSLNLEKLKR